MGGPENGTAAMRRVHVLNVALAVLGVFLSADSVAGATITTPNSSANTYGHDSRTTVFHSFGRTLQLQLAASQLSEIPAGSAINGVAFRLALGHVPRFSPSFTDWRVTLAQAARPVDSMSSTFADNMINPVLVRSGPLSIARDTYLTSGMQPPVFGPTISFSTPYRYLGGDLVILITHPGNGVQLAFGDLDGTDGSGYGMLFRALWAQGFNATTSEMQDAFTVTQLSFDPVPEPRSLVLSAVLVASSVMVRSKWTSPRRG
jgi:hypothetical protein